MLSLPSHEPRLNTQCGPAQSKLINLDVLKAVQTLRDVYIYVTNNLKLVQPAQ